MYILMCNGIIDKIGSLTGKVSATARKNTVKWFIEDMEKLIVDAQARGVEVIITTPTPADEWMDSPVENYLNAYLGFDMMAEQLIELAAKYSGAPDYPEVAKAAIAEMFRQVGKFEYSEQEPNLLKKGVMVRHLVLPSCRQDSIDALRALSETVPADEILLSLMSQYTPEFALDTPYKELHRRVTTFEYSSVVKEAERLGFDGFIQEKSSASAKYTPDF